MSTSRHAVTNEAERRTERKRIVDMYSSLGGHGDPLDPTKGRELGQGVYLRKAGLEDGENLVRSVWGFRDLRRRVSAPSGRDHYHPQHRSRRFLTVAHPSVSSVAHR